MLSFHVKCWSITTPRNLVELICERTLSFIYRLFPVAILRAERLCLNNPLRKPRTISKPSLQGLFEYHNADGHMSAISKAKQQEEIQTLQKEKDGQNGDVSSERFRSLLQGSEESPTRSYSSST